MVHAVVAGNVVIGVGPRADLSPGRAGIQAIGPSRSMRISGNEVADVGPPVDIIGVTAGIEYVGAFGQLEVSENRVRRATTDPEPASPTADWFALLVQAPRPDQPIVDPNFAFLASEALTFAVVGARVLRLAPGGGQLTVQGNQLESFGRSGTVRIATRATCVLANNQCILNPLSESPVAAVDAAVVVASGNYVRGRGRPDDVALAIGVPSGALTALGNITIGQIRVNGQPLDAPWLQLNTRLA
jgi:hypothetical protein